MENVTVIKTNKDGKKSGYVAAGKVQIDELFKNDSNLAEVVLQDENGNGLCYFHHTNFNFNN